MTRSICPLVIGFSLSALALAAGETLAPEAALLDRTGQRVKQFWDEVTAVACTENLMQEKLNEKGKVVLKNQTLYDYLISLRWNGDDLLVDESRLPVGQPQKKTPAGSLLATQGFATLLLIFHPQFQPSYYFTFPPDENIGGTKLRRVAFLSRNSARSPGVLELKGREYPIAWEGTAWIDPASSMVVRVQAHWKEPAEEIGLEELSSEVQYAPVTLRDKRTYWLPEAARIAVKTHHQQWRNSHRFEHYRLFAVDAEDKVQEIKH